MPHTHGHAVAAQPSPSLLRMSALGRLGLAAAVSAGLWLGVVWAWA